MEFLLETTRELPKMLKGTRSGPLANWYAAAAGAATLDWSPVRGELLKSPAQVAPELRGLVQVLADLAEQKRVARSALALAWLLRHPAGIMPIIGTANPEHLIENSSADEISVTRDEWYALFNAAADVGAAAGT